MPHISHQLLIGASAAKIYNAITSQGLLLGVFSILQPYFTSTFNILPGSLLPSLEINISP